MNYTLDKLRAFESKMSSLIVVAHHEQKYGDKPYTYHLRMVAEKAHELFGEGKIHNPTIGDVKLATASLGHDLYEDTYVTKESLLEAGYDSEIVQAIDLVTKKEGLSYKDYLRNLSKDELAWKVKVADTYSNLTESIKVSDVKRVRKYSTQLELLYKFKDF